MYGLVDGRGLAVVDPGLPGPKSWNALKTRLRSAGFRVRDVHTVLVTHSHPDHFGCAGRLRREAGAEVVAHQAFTTWSLSKRATVSEAEAERVEEAAIRAAESYHGPSSDELPSLAADQDAGAGGLGRSNGGGEGALRRAAPWGGPTPWGGHHPAPPVVHRWAYRALRLLFSPPDPTRRVVHGAPLRRAGPRLVRGAHAGPHPDHLSCGTGARGAAERRPRLPTITPHIAVPCTAIRCARTSPPSPGVVAGGGSRPARARSPVHRRARPGRGDQGSPPRAHGPAAQGVDRTRAGRGRGLSREVFPRRHVGVMAESETFAHLEHLRPPATPSAGRRPAPRLPRRRLAGGPARPAPRRRVTGRFRRPLRAVARRDASRGAAGSRHPAGSLRSSGLRP